MRGTFGAGFSAPNVPTVYGAYEDNENYYVSMEVIKGRFLLDQAE